MFLLYEKLKFLKNNMNIWNKETFVIVHHLVSDVEEELNMAYTKIQCDGYSNNLRSEEKVYMNRLEDALHKEHIFWKEKAKVKWNLEGNRNT